jgi:hypothetical protein
MMWIDIGVIVLLTLRIALCRPALPQLSDPNNDVSLPGGKKGTAGVPLRCYGEVNEHFLESPHQETVGLSQLHIHVIPDSKVRR